MNPNPEDRETKTQGSTLSPERFARVRVLFEAALDRPARERRAYLEGACGADREMLEQVEGMLAAEARDGGLLRETPSSSSSSAEEGRFPAGTVLAGRYRILGMLGRGGMGEVYKAFDLILNQVVALKFLNPAYVSEAALARFRNEVRIARQVSHPNVCRVYDLGMVEGLHFLSMEFIDGEDLASLLRRIGRLPQDKAMEFTRKICAGLGAAHERGVLHRDLKPANVMIDGRGQPRITDFGLAGLAAEIPLSDLRSGTPAYMSPEQKAGREVTVRSDIYSLGLVMYEMFTGKQRKDTTSSPSEIVKDLDPAIERVILRCLNEEPKRRPPTPMSVAMGLPGGDPIAAALAAGETPSPEMVAASQEKEGFSARTAVLCFCLFVALLFAGEWLIRPVVLESFADFQTPPDALAYRAREILSQFGYTEPAAYALYGFDCCDQSNLDFLQTLERPRRNQMLAGHRPAVMHFWYRQHRKDIVYAASPNAGGIAINYSTPENTEPGMIRLALDGKERLIRLEARPVEPATPGDSVKSAAELWPLLFNAAGLDLNQFTAVTPQRIPPTALDAQAAWEGFLEAGHPEKVRVEAASWLGRPVFFEVEGDWRPKGVPEPLRVAWWFPAVVAFMALAAIFGATFTAQRNLRSGRGDRRGAAVIAAATALPMLAGAFLSANHIAGFQELGLIAQMLAFCLLVSAVAWLAYIAVEPYMRRNWPDSLISWTRLQAGRWRDPLVASHALAGMTVMMCGLTVMSVVYRTTDSPLFSSPLSSLDSPVRFAASVVGNVGNRLQEAMWMVVLLVLVRLLVRRVWVADIIVSLLFATFWVPAQSSPIRFAFSVPFMYSLLWVVRRFGLVALMAAWITDALLEAAPESWTAWYSGYHVMKVAIIIGLAAWALWVVLTTGQAKREALE